MAFLAELQRGKRLKVVPVEAQRDRSGANTALAGANELEGEAERWKYFFESGCTGWYEAIKEHTFRSTFVDLHREEAAAIVNHWERRQRATAAGEAAGRCTEAALASMLREAGEALEPLKRRLDEAVRAECAASPAGLAFVKLSTRSPKDSKGALARAEVAYAGRLALEPEADSNARWRLLSEEVTRAGGVADGAAGLALLLDSERVFEDLEYALRGPKEEPIGRAVGSGVAPAAAGPAAAGPGLAAAVPVPAPEPTAAAPAAAGLAAPSTLYDLSLVARAWDPRLKPESEFRGIAWEGRLTCLCQYFHPLFFPELMELKATIEADCREMFQRPAVQTAVQNLGGHCIVDFAWLGSGEVIIVELNPFDGVCLGTFPASTGLFLWEDAADRAVMKGEAPFELRVRDCPLSDDTLRGQCNPAWRRIIYGEGRRVA